MELIRIWNVSVASIIRFSFGFLAIKNTIMHLVCTPFSFFCLDSVQIFLLFCLNCVLFELCFVSLFLQFCLHCFLGGVVSISFIYLFHSIQCYYSFDYRDHAFDLPARGTRKRKIKIGEISGPMAPARSALSVRQYHRKDESKILPTKRLGMDLKEI